MIKRRKYIRRQSPKRAAETRIYNRTRKSFLNAHPFCEAHRLVTGDDISVPATQIHHTRGKRHSLINATEHWKSVCATCHDWITNHTTKARELGLVCELGQWNTPSKP